MPIPNTMSSIPIPIIPVDTHDTDTDDSDTDDNDTETSIDVIVTDNPYR